MEDSSVGEGTDTVGPSEKLSVIVGSTVLPEEYGEKVELSEVVKSREDVVVNCPAFVAVVNGAVDIDEPLKEPQGLDGVYVKRELSDDVVVN